MENDHTNLHSENYLMRHDSYDLLNKFQKNFSVTHAHQSECRIP